MGYPVKSPKKLIEVALPLDDINIEAAREKSIRHGHPSTLHLWWARRPLAAARAVIFAQLVNDPSWKWEMEHVGEVPPSHLKASWAAKRKQLFGLISELVKWDNTTNYDLFAKANAEIRKSWRETCEINIDHPEAAEIFNKERLPGLHDPFAGGGAIPLEAQRLGLDTVATDLNPVAVLLNKAMVELPPKFAGCPPVHPDALSAPENYGREWSGAQGLAEDVRKYGEWLCSEASRRLGGNYPKIHVTPEMAESRSDLKHLVGKDLTVIAWLWARTVKSPNPAFAEVDVPLASNFVLHSKAGAERWVEVVADGNGYKFHVRTGRPPRGASNGTKAGERGADFLCVLSNSPIPAQYIRSEAQAGRMGERLMAVVAAAGRERVYLSPNDGQEEAAREVSPTWQPDVEFYQQALGFRIGNYGMSQWSDLFTARQLTTLACVANLVGEARDRIAEDVQSSANSKLSEGDYADCVAVHLALVASKAAVFWNSLSRWRAGEGKTAPAFGRQAIAMVWDFAEVNPFAGAGGDLQGIVDGNAKAIAALPGVGSGIAMQAEAQRQEFSLNRVVSTDPPYYDNVGYADLSDFFYVWLRRTLREVMPSLFSSIVTPKAEELVATPSRHGGKTGAEEYFMEGMADALERIANFAHPAHPCTIYYAFKQAETKAGADTKSTGWETFLAAVIRSGFTVTGSWPMRTENKSRLRGQASNALASSIVLVCRKRSSNTGTISRRAFIRELNTILPEALDEMTMGAGVDQSPVAPVDLSQAIIGPGMAVFSKYEAVLEADGTPMTVDTALRLINRFLAEDDFDADTQFCLRWFEQHGWNEGQYGEADVLARAKATSVGGVVEAGVLFSGGGKVRLMRWADYPEDWDPAKDKRLPIWEALHQLIRAFKKDGESGSGQILGVIKDKTEAVRQLAYRLYTLCERRGWAEDARAYNELVSSWSAIETVANTVPDPHAAEQLGLDFGGEK